MNDDTVSQIENILNDGVTEDNLLDIVFDNKPHVISSVGNTIHFFGGDLDRTKFAHFALPFIEENIDMIEHLIHGESQESESFDLVIQKFIELFVVVMVSQIQFYDRHKDTIKAEA